MGLETLVREDVPGFYPDKIVELMHYYSMLFQMDLDYDTLFGPLPILDHFEYLAYIFPYKITNPDAKDERLIAANFIVPAFILIICPVEYASIIGNNIPKISYELNYSLSKEEQTLDGFKSIDVSSLKERGGIVRVEFSRVSILSVDKVIRLIKESGGSVKIDANSPHIIIMETGAIGLAEKSEFIRDRLSALI